MYAIHVVVNSHSVDKLREQARQNIIHKYQSKIKKEDILRVLDSLSDSNSHLLSYRHPIDMILGYLHKYFKPNQPEGTFSLAVSTLGVVWCG